MEAGERGLPRSAHVNQDIIEGGSIVIAKAFNIDNNLHHVDERLAARELVDYGFVMKISEEQRMRRPWVRSRCELS